MTPRLGKAARLAKAVAQVPGLEGVGVLLTMADAAEMKSAPQSNRESFLRFSGAVRRDSAVARWFAEEPGDLSAIARRWFAVMRRCGADVRELVHDGCPVVCVDDAPFAYVDAFTAHVNVGFFHGASLRDPAGLLQGSGKHMRHVKLKPGLAVDAPALEALIGAAYRDIGARLQGSPDLNRRRAAPARGPDTPSRRRAP